MANKKSAKKRAIKSAAQREKNRAGRSKVRTAIKRVRIAATGTDAQGAEKLLKDAISLVDRSARKGLLHRNAAARTKSRLSKAVAKASK